MRETRGVWGGARGPGVVDTSVKGSEVGAFAFVGARRAARRGGGVDGSAY